VDGNKRVAVTATFVFLVLNGYVMTASNDAVRDYALRIARHHGDYRIASIREWLRRHSRERAAAEVAARRDFNREIYASLDPIREWFSGRPTG
jgi:hypothetical protein